MRRRRVSAYTAMYPSDRAINGPRGSAGVVLERQRVGSLQLTSYLIRGLTALLVGLADVLAAESWMTWSMPSHRSSFE